MGTEFNLSSKNAVVIVAHPDDETLWSGGFILSHPFFHWYVISLCRGDDRERAPKFYKALEVLQANGVMGQLDDGPEQIPLDTAIVKNTVLSLLPKRHFDLIITHNPSGEYTRHLRHEELSRAVIELWNEDRISTRELWTFAYEDGNKQYFPRAEEKAFRYLLSDRIWKVKYTLITQTYGFPPDGFEAQTTPRIEAFWKFNVAINANKFLQKLSEKTRMEK